MDESKINKFKAAGMPNRFIRDIKAAYRLRMTRWGVWTGVFAFLIISMCVFGLALVVGVSVLNSRLAASVSEQVDGYLIFQNVGLGGLVGLFGGIFLTGTMGAILVRSLPGEHRLAGLYTLIESEPIWSIDTKAVRWAVDTRHPDEDATTLAGRAAMRYGRSMALIAAPFLVIGGALALYEVGNYAIVSERGIYRDGSETVYLWSDIEFVEVGCNETSDSSSLIYQLHFSDGWDIDLADSDPVGMTLLEALERADDTVLAHNKEFKLWEWLERNPMHPECLAHYRNSWPTDEFQRLRSVLHVDELT